MAYGAFTPIFQISANGENVTANFQNRATEIHVELASGNGSQDTCTITVDDRDWLMATPHVGDKISVSLGYKEVGLAFLGTFEVDEVTFVGPPKAIQIHGNAEGFNSAIKSPVVKNFQGKTVKEILEDYAGKLGLSVTVDSSIGGQTIPYRNFTQSPMQVFGELERMYNGVAKISDGKLAFASRDSGMSADGETIPLIVLRKEHLGSWQVAHKNRSDYSQTTAAYRDKDTNQDKQVQSQTKASTLGQGESGGEKPYSIKGVFPSQAEAQAAADSTMRSLDRNLGEGLFTLAQGDPWIRDQNRLLVIGTRDGIDGSFVADLVSHAYTRDGALTTSIRTQPDGAGTSFAPLYEADPGAALAPGPGEVTGMLLPPTGPNGQPPAQGQYGPGGA